MNLDVIILAAGEGTRMKSKVLKVLHPIAGKTLVEHVIDASDIAGCGKKIVVIGSKKEQIEEKLKHLDLTYVHQTERLGTGHAVMMCEAEIEEDEDVMILCGDTPLLPGEVLKTFVAFHKEKQYACTVMTAILENPHGYGRMVRNEKGLLTAIVEEKDASLEIKAIQEINSGVYCFKGALLKQYLHRIDNKNVQGEYYLTDLVKLLSADGHAVGSQIIDDFDSLLGVNSREQLAQAERIMKDRINKFHMAEGVTLVDPANTYIEKDVKIGRDTVVYPGTIIKGTTTIGEDCVIGPHADITSCQIGNDTEIKHSTVMDSIIGDHTAVGPYAFVRPGSTIGNHVKVGDFVEIKNAVIGNGTKISHLAYVGDGDVGENCNISCGVVFSNYDGKNKFRSIVEDNAFVGCNVNLVSPVRVGKNAYVAAGSTITMDIPEDALGIAREKQRNIEGWVERTGRKK